MTPTSWSVTPSFFETLRALQGRQLHVWLLLAERSRADTGTVFLGQPAIARELGMRQPHVARAIRALRERKLLELTGTSHLGTDTHLVHCLDGSPPLRSAQIEHRPRHTTGGIQTGTGCNPDIPTEPVRIPPMVYPPRPTPYQPRGRTLSHHELRRLLRPDAAS